MAKSKWQIRTEGHSGPAGAQASVTRIHLDGDAWGIIVDERLRSKTSFTPSAHSHPEWDELIVPLDGLYWVKIGDWQRKISPGEVAIIPGQVEHDSGIASNLAGVRFLVLLLSRDLNALQGCAFGGALLPDGVLSWLKGMVRLIKNSNDEELSGIALQALPDFFRGVASRERLPAQETHADPIVLEAIQILRRPEPASLDQLSTELGLSSAHLQKRFTRAVGCSPLHYARAWKLDAIASRLRVDRETPIIDVAAEYYFHDAKHFRELFKDRFGMTPGMFRKNPPPEDAK